MSYAIKEIFLTLQGEGAHAGRAAVFCRFSGCNLWSAASRTAPARHANSATRILSAPTARSVAAMRHRTTSPTPSPASGAGEHGYRYVVLTAASRCWQVDADLIDALRARGFTIGLETNGTIEVPDGGGLDLRQPQGRRGIAGTAGRRTQAGVSAARCQPGGLRRSRLRALLAATDGRARTLPPTPSAPSTTASAIRNGGSACRRTRPSGSGKGWDFRNVGTDKIVSVRGRPCAVGHHAGGGEPGDPRPFVPRRGHRARHARSGDRDGARSRLLQRNIADVQKLLDHKLLNKIEALGDADPGEPGAIRLGTGPARRPDHAGQHPPRQ